MKPELRPISVTIVDLMGAFLPGTVWIILFITVRKLFWLWITPPQSKTDDITPLSVTLNLTENKATAFYIVLLIFSFIIGYSMKLLAMLIAERFTAVFPYFWNEQLKKKKEKREFESYLFPYNEEFKDKKYFQQIKKVLNEKFTWGKDSSDLDQLVSLPREKTQPFSICRRILRVLNPFLWEESELREATVRMLGSILLSAIFSLVCAFLSLFFNSWVTSIIWIITSSIAVIFLTIAFRRARKTEVAYTYLNFLIAINYKADSENSSK